MTMRVSADEIAERLSAERKVTPLPDGSGRRHPPGVLLERLRPAARGLGVTRVGRLTGLDRLGLPVWMAVRPNAGNLSVSQGKSLDDAGAALSAMMEAIELAVAEDPPVETITGSTDDLLRAGESPLVVARMIRRGWTAPAADEAIDWIAGIDLPTGQRRLVPAGYVVLDDGARTRFWPSSDGLAAGAGLAEAIVHGLCELVERDAGAIWSFRTPPERAAREIDVAAVGEPTLARLSGAVADAGLRLRLFDATTDIGIPCHHAVIAGEAAEPGRPRQFDAMAGTCAHPDAVRSAVGAVLEAAQSRLTAISGARDDIPPDAWDKPRPADHADVLDPPDGRARCALPASVTADGTAAGLYEEILQRLLGARVGDVILVPLRDDPETGLVVVKMIVPGLEQAPQTANRKLGPRAIAAMLGVR